MPWIHKRFSIFMHDDSDLKKWAKAELEKKTPTELLDLYSHAKAEAELVQEFNVEVIYAAL
jgi:hypothetical protein